MYQIKVLISQKESVIDPVARALQEAVNAWGADEFSEFQTKKVIECKVAADSKEEAEQRAQELAEKILVNDAMEDYELCVEEAR